MVVAPGRGVTAEAASNVLLTLGAGAEHEGEHILGCRVVYGDDDPATVDG